MTAEFYSTRDHTLRVPFSEALMTGMARDGGLFMPVSLEPFSPGQMSRLAGLGFPETARVLAHHWLNKAIPAPSLDTIVADAFDFPIPVRQLDRRGHVMELFWGPTLAFKDVAARFMARCVAYYLRQWDCGRTILVATSGDTGGAVGHGFVGIDGVNVFILFPKSGVSQVQRRQLTRIGKNVTALEIDGTFDDCQRLVKQCFRDQRLNRKHGFMSANSINISRIIPQSFYSFWAALKLNAEFPDKKLVVCVPSGNLGNLTGALWAKRMGAPIHFFVAANNINHPFCQFLETGVFEGVPSISTISNAMDIGHPNNYHRIVDMYDHDIEAIRRHIRGIFFDDEMTRQQILKTFETFDYQVCPHTAIALAAADAFKTKTDSDTIFLSLATAHPAKFAEVVEPVIGQEIQLPAQLLAGFSHDARVVPLPNAFSSLQQYLLDQEGTESNLQRRL